MKCCLGTVSFVSLFFLTLDAKSKIPDRCQVDQLTRNCDFFREKKESQFIEYPDGTRFPNPAWISVSGYGDMGGGNYGSIEQLEKQQREQIEKIYKEQAQMMDLLGDAYSPEFELALSSSATLSNVQLMSNGGASLENVTMMLPWPPEKKTIQKIKAVPWAEFESRILRRLPLRNKKELIAIFSKKPMMGYGMGIQSTQIVLQEGDRPLDEKRLKRLKALVEETKNLMLSEIDQGKPYLSLSSEQRALYDRIRLIRFVPPTEPGVMDSPSCLGGPNAFYQPGKHEFIICPSMANFPDASLVKTIAHEMGHSIDPCGCRHSVHRVDSQALREERMQGGHPMGMVPSGDFIERQAFDPISKKILIAKGYLEEVSPAISPDRYPQEKTLSCLKESMGLKVMTEEILLLEAQESDRLRRSKESDAPRTPIEQIRKKIQENGPADCQYSVALGSPEIREAMADAWGSKVLGRYFEKNPPRNEQERLAPFAVYYPSICGEQDPPSIDLQRAHPYGRERADMIILTDHRVRKAYGCPAQGQQRDCLRFMGTLKTPEVPGADLSSEEAPKPRGQK